VLKFHEVYPDLYNNEYIVLLIPFLLVSCFVVSGVQYEFVTVVLPLYVLANSPIKPPSSLAPVTTPIAYVFVTSI